MRKLFLINNPDLFQGEKYLKQNKNYFEGWYYKNTNDKNSISFIPGICIDDENKHAFIQVITNNKSYYISYPIEEFSFNHKPFYIKIGNSFFSKDKLLIDIDDNENNISIFGNLKYSNSINIKRNIFSSNIMGPFSFIPFMECNHAILSMKNNINGSLSINGNEMVFNNGIGYIEKDFGFSFPKSYIWSQANNFKNSNASFMISIADIPFKLFDFRGFICSLIINNNEYRFATYNFSKIIKYETNDNSFNIVLKKGKYSLNVKAKTYCKNKLIAPVNGKMTKNIFESISTSVKLTLKYNNKIIFCDSSKNCGLEIVT